MSREWKKWNERNVDDDDKDEEFFDVDVFLYAKVLKFCLLRKNIELFYSRWAFGSVPCEQVSWFRKNINLNAVGWGFSRKKSNLVLEQIEKLKNLSNRDRIWL